MTHHVPAELQNYVRQSIIPQYAKSHLFEQISDLCAKENESGVKNQYIKALKKAEKMR